MVIPGRFVLQKSYKWRCDKSLHAIVDSACVVWYGVCMNYVVYLFECPDTKRCFYVGVSSNPNSRCKAHMSGCDTTTGAWVKRLREQGKAPVFNVAVHNLSRKGAFELERTLIKEFDSEFLLNKQYNTRKPAKKSIAKKLSDRQESYISRLFSQLFAKSA